MGNIQRILVWVTASKGCITVIESTLEIARKFGAHVYVLDVIHNPFANQGWNLPIPSLDVEYESLISEVRKELARIVKKEKAKGFALDSLVREGSPSDQLMKVVAEEKIDLLVMPAHEEDRMEHMMFGRVNEKIIRK